MNEQQFETEEDLKAQVAELQSKLAEKQEETLGEEQEKVTFPTVSATLKLDKNGSNVILQRVTPPEALILCAMHHVNAGSLPLSDLQPKGAYTTTIQGEKARLVAKYGVKKVDAAFPGNEPKMPMTFRQAMSSGLGKALPDSQLLEFDLAKA